MAARQVRGGRCHPNRVHVLTPWSLPAPQSRQQRKQPAEVLIKSLEPWPSEQHHYSRSLQTPFPTANFYLSAYFIEN